MKRLFLIVFLLQFALIASADYYPHNIKWITEENVYVTTAPKTIAYAFPYYKCFSNEYVNKDKLYRECIPYTGYKRKKINKSTPLKVRGFANAEKQLYYDTYVIEIKDYLYFLPSSAVLDNSVIDAVNKGLADGLNSLELAIEKAESEYESTHLAVRMAYADSLSYYQDLKVTLPRKIRSIKQKIEADFKAVEHEVIASWYNGLSASAKRTYDNVVEMVGEGLHSPNSAGGCDYTFHYINKSKKTIKYANISIDFYNAVDDRVYCEIDGGSSCTCKDTGPISTGDWGGGTWDCVIYNWSASYAELTRFSIIYTDGSQVSVSLSDVRQLLTKPNGTSRAVAKFGGPLTSVISKKVAPYEHLQKNIDRVINKWSERVADVNSEDFSVYYKDRDEKHRATFYKLSGLKSDIKQCKSQLYKFKTDNLIF